MQKVKTWYIVCDINSELYYVMGNVEVYITTLSCGIPSAVPNLCATCLIVVTILIFTGPLLTIYTHNISNMRFSGNGDIISFHTFRRMKSNYIYIYMIWILFRINVAVYIYIYIYMIWILFQINVAVFRGIPSLYKYNVFTNSYIICWLAISLASITYGKPICCGLTPLTEELTSIHHITITLQDTFGVMVQMSQRTWF